MDGLLTKHLDIWSAAKAPKAAGGRGRGRKANGAISPHGIKKLRELILELAVRGKLVPQNPEDEPASLLLEEIAAEKDQLVKEKKIKKPNNFPEITGQDKPFSLPKGWQYSRLNDLGEWGAGATPARRNQDYYGGKISWFKSGELVGDYISMSEEHVTELALQETSLRYNKVGDVLVAMYGATIGKTSILEVSATTNQAVCACTPFTGFANIFLLTLLKAYKGRLVGMGAGGAQPNISREKIISTVIALPPLAEQHRIVAKVDELMALCDRLEQQQSDNNATHQTLLATLLTSLTTAADHTDFTETWQRIQSHFHTLFTTEDSIDQLKQTILQLAVMGKLVPQNPDDEPASVLLEKIAAEKARLIKEKKIKKPKKLPKISEKEKPFDLPVGWVWERLGIFSIIGTGATPLRSNPYYYTPAEINWVTSGETSDDFIFKTKEKISQLAVDKTNVTVYPVGTLIIAMYGQGKTRGQISELSIEAGTNQACAAAQLIAEPIHHRKYIKLFFSKAYEEIREHSAGGAQPNLNVGKITQTVIPLPPIAEQHRIVAKVDELMAICNTLKTRLNESQTTQINLADAMVKQAHQAVNVNLATQPLRKTGKTKSADSDGTIDHPSGK